MAGNSVPGFFGRKARSLKPVSLDITFATDLSGSMRSFASFVSSIDTIRSLETALLDEGVGVSSSNRYSICTGAGGIDAPLGAHDELLEIEVSVANSGAFKRWATGEEIASPQAYWPRLSATTGNDTEDMALAAHLIAGGSRQYNEPSLRILVSAGDLQCPYLEDVIDNSVALATLTASSTAQRYVGVHNANIVLAEPASPNPAPSGQIFGFVFTTSTTGVAIYLDGTIPRYRTDVDTSKVTISYAGSTNGYGPSPGQADEIINFTRQTNGALYKLALTNTVNGTVALGRSLGEVLGGYLYEAAS